MSKKCKKKLWKSSRSLFLKNVNRGGTCSAAGFRLVRTYLGIKGNQRLRLERSRKRGVCSAFVVSLHQQIATESRMIFPETFMRDYFSIQIKHIPDSFQELCCAIRLLENVVCSFVQYSCSIGGVNISCAKNELNVRAGGPNSLQDFEP